MWQYEMVGLNSPIQKECSNEKYMSKAQLLLLLCPSGDMDQTDHSPYIQDT